ncbi:MAG: universal stress protein [Alphaproteobacteria bacterium]|nr:universal stress protein [Alphaproteobacteria bacterium]MBE8220847.1 universal stress protein [Alphaproteobacteria bacterium]
MDINKHLARKFLVLIDGTPEYLAALRFAARRAHGTGGKVVLLLVIENEGFEHWLGVGTLMKEEAHGEASRILEEAATLVEILSGDRPETYLREGAADEEIMRLIGEDDTISTLVLASGVVGAAVSDSNDTGPLVSAVAQGRSGFNVPITIVPGALSDDEIDALT